MLASMKHLSSVVKIKSSASIDNFAAKLHYRCTTLFLLVCVIMVTFSQYFGDHISCEGDHKWLDDFGTFVKSFCFIGGSYTVTKHQNKTNTRLYPGVGPHDTEKDELKYHFHYQWVPFVLFLQAILFYAPHYVWKCYEGGKLKQYVLGFELMSLSSQDYQQTFHRSADKKDLVVPSKSDRHKKLREICKCFVDHLYVYRTWTFGLVLAEVLNFVNVVGNMYFTNLFLGGVFLTYGPDVVKLVYTDSEYRVDPMEVIFPKMTHCIVSKFGDTGTIVTKDFLCVMTLNIINEKIYVFLWFWFVILAATSGLALVWRLVAFLLHSHNEFFDRCVFYSTLPDNNQEVFDLVSKKLDFGSWTFLHYVGNSMDKFLFKDLLTHLSYELCPKGRYAVENKCYCEESGV